MSEKLKVGILGGTGMVGQRFISLLENHPWFLGCQFHPEFKSRPNSSEIAEKINFSSQNYFTETFKRHMIEDHRPLFPVLDLVMLHIKLNTGAKIIKDSPLRLVKKINIPVLFLFSKQDKFSIPQKSKILLKKFLYI